MPQLIDFNKYGSGKSGDPSAGSGNINTRAACTGTAGATTLNTTLSASLGDMIIIHQTRGAGEGWWEVNYVISDGGAFLNLALPLDHDYTSGAQAVLMPQYTPGTLSGAITTPNWDGAIGGLVALMCNGDLTVTGGILINGANGSTGNNTAGSITTGGGFRGGYYRGAANTNGGSQGEGTAGAGAESTSANGNGGGAGVNLTGGFGRASGGGGANGGGGGTPTTYIGEAGRSQRGTGGSVVGSSNLVTICLGGGGGGGMTTNTSEIVGAGGSGGGIIMIFAKNIDFSASTGLSCNGGNGGNTDQDGGGAGGAGAGGSILVKCQSAVLGSNKLTATGGIGGTTPDSNNPGGVGGAGRIHIDYYSGYTGSTNPTIDASQNSSLAPAIYSGMI